MGKSNLANDRLDCVLGKCESMGPIRDGKKEQRWCTIWLHVQAADMVVWYVVRL